jgi:predicted transcriptional regulator
MDTDLLGQTAKIVASHVANNAVPQTQISNLIRDVYQTLTALRQPSISHSGSDLIPHQSSHPLSNVTTLSDVPRPNPAVDIRKSVTRTHIICLEDGKRMKTLKRHLSASFGMTPEQYRARWGLPANYPMVAPEYTERRSAMAKQNGLGLRADSEDDVEAIAIDSSEVARKKNPPVAITKVPVGVSGLKKYRRRAA